MTGLFSKKTKKYGSLTNYTPIQTSTSLQTSKQKPQDRWGTYSLGSANTNKIVNNKKDLLFSGSNGYTPNTPASYVKINNNKPQNNIDTTTTQQQRDTTQTNYLDDYFKKYLGNIDKQRLDRQAYSQEEQQLARDETDQYAKQQQQLADQTAQMLEAQKPVFKKRSEKAQALIRQGLEAVNAKGAQAKTSIEDQTGETLRGQAQSKREVDARRNAIFAGNNTSDSYGVGGYQLEQTNADNEFLREQNKTLRSRDQQLADIDTQIVSAQATAEQAINDEVAKYEDALYAIDYQLGSNQIAKQQAIENAYSTLKRALFDIRNNYNITTAELDMARMEIEKAQIESMGQNAKIGADDLSPEFIASGMQTPTTYEDMLYLQTKGNGTRLPAKDQGTVNNALTRLDELQSMIKNTPSVKAIGGLPNWMLGTTGQKYKATLADINDSLGRLRSGGAITKDELDTFAMMMPKFGDTQETAFYKIGQMRDRLNTYLGKVQSVPADNGGNAEVDSSDPLQLFR